jgi:hypothetical protein
MMMDINKSAKVNYYLYFNFKKACSPICLTCS